MSSFVELTESEEELETSIRRLSSNPEFFNVVSALKNQTSMLLQDKKDLAKRSKTLRKKYESEIQELKNTLKKKRKKLKTSRRALLDYHLDQNRSESDEIQELRNHIKHCENTVQELLTLRMFLRSSIEWIKASVSESFPRYNSFLYTAIFSKFGMFITNSSIDFIKETEGTENSDDGIELFWMPYIMWIVLGIIGWFVDRHVSRRGSISRKLDTVRDATFGAIPMRIMRQALDNENDDQETSIQNLLTRSTNLDVKYRLGTGLDP